MRGNAFQDPHVNAFHGDRFDLHGEDGAAYCLLSAQNVVLNAVVEEHAFNVFNLKVHGSFFTRAGLVLRSNKTRTVVTIDYHPHASLVEYNGLPFDVGAAATLEDISVRLPHINALEVNTSQWAIKVTAHAINYGVLKERYLNDKPDQLDVNIVPLEDPLKKGVAPHGIIGQTADGDDMAVDGAKDDLRELSKHAMKGSGGLYEVFPRAQAEGAIEGAIDDYKVGSVLSTEFKFSRFGSLSAPVRNIATLSGKKYKRNTMRLSASTSGDDSVDVAASSL